MSLNKSRGNMYPWVTHTHSHLAGRCSHQCKYCYVQVSENRYRSGLYSGPSRLREKELLVNYGTGKTIFIEHMNDLFAKDISDHTIASVITHAKSFPENTYVFQTKNPARFYDWLNDFYAPASTILGTTIESNREYPGLSTAPTARERYLAMKDIPAYLKTFVTIEPVLDFDVDILAAWISEIHPDFLNLGADSKGIGLIEPTVEKIMQLTEKLKGYGVELREKHNLQRLVGGSK
jgi:DNA repair photolyase